MNDIQLLERKSDEMVIGCTLIALSFGGGWCGLWKIFGDEQSIPLILREQIIQ